MIHKAYLADHAYFRNVNIFNSKFGYINFIDKFIYKDYKHISPKNVDPPTLADKFNKPLLTEEKFKQYFPNENFNEIVNNKMYLCDMNYDGYREMEAIDLKNTDFVKCKFKKTMFRNLEFENVLFLDSKIKEMYFLGNLVNHSYYINTSIYESTITDNIFANCVFENVKFVDVDFYDTLFNMCVFKNCTFEDCIITFKDKQVFDLNCIFDNCDFGDATFESKLHLKTNMYASLHTNKYVCNITNYNNE